MQHDIFSKDEADNYFARNDGHETVNDPFSDVLRTLDLKGKKILDIGCADGYKLAEFTDSDCYGIDPSQKAIDAGLERFPRLKLQVGVSHDLPYADDTFDVVWLNFVFHWLDRSKLMKTVSEIDRVLKDGGTLVISDFSVPLPQKRPYFHRTDVEMFTYKQYYPALFTSSNLYTSLSSVVADHVALHVPLFVTVLKKDTNNYSVV